MSSFIIEGGLKLKGEIEPQGAKNEALQILCAVLLSEEEIIINTKNFSKKIETNASVIREWN